MATAKDTSFSSQEKATTNILHFHCKDKTCKGKRQFYLCGFKPGQSHILFYSVTVLIYITTCTYAVKFRSSCQWNTAVKWLRHLVMEEAVPWAGKFLLPVPASPPLCSFRPPTGYGEFDEGQSWSSHQSVQPSQTREFSLRRARRLRAPAVLQGELELAQGRTKQPRAAKGKKGKSKANLPFLDSAAGQGVHWTAAWGTTEKLEAE